MWILSAVWRNAANKLPTLILACNKSLRCYYLCSCYRYNHARESGVETSNGPIFSFYIYLLICHWYNYFNRTIRTFELTSNNYECSVFCFPCRSIPFYSIQFNVIIIVVYTIFHSISWLSLPCIFIKWIIHTLTFWIHEPFAIAFNLAYSWSNNILCQIRLVDRLSLIISLFS